MMSILYIIFTIYLVKLLMILAKIFAVILSVWLLLLLTKRLLMHFMYHKIKKVVIIRQKDIIRRHSIPVGYSQGYHISEHYKYEYEKIGVKYKTRVYFGEKLFFFFTFHDSDNFFGRMLSDNLVIANKI